MVKPQSLAEVAFSHFAAIEEATSDRAHGWLWLRDKLGHWCLRKAEAEYARPAMADRWIARYQAVRGIE